MEDDWWPDLLRHIADEDPWADPQVVVAEMRNYEDDRLPGVRFLWTALLSAEELQRLDGRLSALKHEVEATGPRPGHHGGGLYSPRFWIPAYVGEERIDCEPLVLGWTSHNRTAMVIDPGFTMTYGLMPRAQADGSIHWDDPAAPEYDVAVVSPPSLYNALRHGAARAVIGRDHLQDYLSLRGKVLIQVYYESRRGPQDAAADALLGPDNRKTAVLRDREIDIRRDPEGGFVAQVWGARQIAGPAGLPISTDVLDADGLVWPGLEGAITQRTARAFRPGEAQIYVRDTVLAAYEGRPDFQVHSLSGGVAFGAQWSVGDTTRIARDVIRMDVRKLYEGVPARVVQHWHAYALTPTPVLQAAGARAEANVGTRAKAAVDGMVRLGRILVATSEALGAGTYGVDEFVGLDPDQLDYAGWWSAPHVEPITRHTPADLDQDAFLTRCLALDKVVVEALAERRLRPVVKAIGPQADTEKFRGLKLLDRLVCLASIAAEAGLSLKDGETLLERLREEAEPRRPLAALFALSDLRQVAGHRKDPDAVLPDALARLGIDPAGTVQGWGFALDRVYDAIAEQLTEIEVVLTASLPGD